MDSPDEVVSAEQPARASRPPAGVAIAGVAILALLVGLGTGWGLGSVLAHALSSNTAQLSSDQSASARLARAEAAVVDINTNLTGGGQAAGTGMIITPTGEVLTNNHVVAGATNIVVTIPSSSTTYGAKVMGVDPTADVALIQLVGASNLPTVRIAPASAVKVGVPVVAVGNALGQGGAPAVTDGTITALNEAITARGENSSEQLSGLIRTDAPINQGDSGGALLDGSGRVVGMITATQVHSYQASDTELGYAVPVTTAMEIVRAIQAGQGSDKIQIVKST